MAIDYKKVNKIIEDLQGTCQSGRHLTNELSLEELIYLDSEIIECPNCGWWVDAGDMFDEDYCNECMEQDGEDY